jgi:protein-disulfide isomerase
MHLGSDSAPVTLVEYVDMQCPYCQRFEARVMPTIVQRYVRAGKVRVELRVLDFVGPDSRRGRDAVVAAGEQDKAFDLALVLYANQGTENTGWLDDDIVARAAGSVPGLDPRKLFDQRDDAAVRRLADRFDGEARSDGITATPSVLLDGEQVHLRDPEDGRGLVRAIEARLGA